jgi:lysophospholipase L1-like esterase
VLLQEHLGDGWEVIAEGLSGRTATIERPDSEGRNGLPYLLPCLLSHAPVDVVVIFLGTNDVNYIDDDRVARCIARLVDVARRAGAGDVVVVCPPPFDGHDLRESFRTELECPVIDAPPYPVVNGDVEHLDAGGHAALAEAVARHLR